MYTDNFDPGFVEFNDHPRIVLEETPHDVIVFEGAWEWVMSKNFEMSFCGLQTNRALFLQGDNERDAAIECVSKQITNGAWNGNDYCFDSCYK